MDETPQAPGTTEVIPVTETIPTDPFPVDEHMVVLARDPQEMRVSQGKLIEWFEARIGTAQAELKNAEENEALARARKWKTSGWTRQVSIARGRVVFYEKCKAALEAGYCIVPDFPTQIFAIRTRKAFPRRNMTSQTGWVPRVTDQRSESAPIGEGRYVSPEAKVAGTSREVKEKVGDRTYERTKHTRWADEFDLPDFPMKLVHPHILDATGKAMALKIFDELGVLPARPQRNRDPIITGRIVRREGPRTVALSFLVAWWIDTRDL